MRIRELVKKHILGLVISALLFSQPALAWTCFSVGKSSTFSGQVANAQVVAKVIVTKRGPYDGMGARDEVASFRNIEARVVRVGRGARLGEDLSLRGMGPQRYCDKCNMDIPIGSEWVLISSSSGRDPRTSRRVFPLYNCTNDFLSLHEGRLVPDMSGPEMPSISEEEFFAWVTERAGAPE